MDTLAAVHVADGPRLEVVHVDHGVRGAAAAADAEFVADLARRLGLPCHRLTADSSRVLKRGRASEGRLRDERYRLLRAAAAAAGAGALFLGHHRDDQVESIVLSALRGAGLKGLSGMPRRRPLFPGGPLLVRPFLDLPRALLREHLDARGIRFRVDESNEQPHFLRNRVRLEFLPALQSEFGPDIDRRLLRLGRIARVLWRRALAASAPPDPGQDSDTLHLALERLAGVPLRRGLSERLQSALRDGRRVMFAVSAGRRLAVDGSRVARLDADLPPPAAEVDMRVLADPHGRILRWIRRTDPERRRALLEEAGRIYLDADRVTLPVCVRRRQPGDRFRPLGFARPGKLKSQLNARKVPRAARDDLVVVADPRGIVAVETLPPAAAAALGPGTRRVLRSRIRRAAARGGGPGARLE